MLDSVFDFLDNFDRHPDAAARAAAWVAARVIAQERRIGGWAWFDPEEAAAALERVPREGAQAPLRGVPFAVKDIIDVAGMPTRHGCGAYADAGPASMDAACVALLRQAGAAPVGKTVTAELAYAQPGPTRNPWNPGHTPGGSSSGSAAVVAAGVVPLALGTQTGGSIIRPAAYCGTVGFKASLGAISMAGVKPASESFDSLGWFAGSVEDAERAGRVLLPACGEK